MTIEQLREYQAEMKRQNDLLLAKLDELTADFKQFKKIYYK
jgi:hypothetical protein